jgi:alpha-N-arabinofuranosidase
MLKVDPNLTLMATGKGDEFLPDGITRDRDWNTTVLRAAVANGGKAPDYLTIHPLVAMPSNLADRPYVERWESAMAHPYYLDQTLFPDLEREIESVEGANATTRIAPTEWGIIIGGDGWRESPTHDALSGAVYNALALNAFLRNGDRVTLANMTAFLHGGCIRRDHSVVYVDPQYYTQKMYADAQPTEPGFLPAATNVPDVDVFSALTADKSHLSVFLVNRTLSDSRNVELDVSGFPLGRVRATILTSADPQTGNSWDKPDTVEPKAFVLPAVAHWGGGTYTLPFTLPPHAVVVLQIARK